MNQKTSKKHALFLILTITLIGLIPRLFLFHLHTVIDSDGPYYATLAKSLLEGEYRCLENVFQWYYPPLYPIAVALISYVAGSLAFATKFASLVFGVGCIPLGYLIADRIYGRLPAIIASCIIALHPELIRLSTCDTAESQFAFLLEVLILVTLRAFTRNHHLSYLWIGLFGALLFLSKPTGVQYFLVCLLSTVIVQWLARTGTSLIVKRTALILCTFGVLSFPYLRFLKSHYGYWTLSELPSINMAASLLKNSGANEAEVYSIAQDGKHMKYITAADNRPEHLGLLHACIQDPIRSARRYATNLGAELLTLSHAFGIVLAPLFLGLLFQLFRKLRSGQSFESDVVFLSMLLPLASLPLVCEVNIRWLLPSLMILFLWCSGGVSGLAYLLSRLRFLRQVRSGSIAALILLAYALSSTLPMISGAKAYAAAYPHEHKQMGLWIKTHMNLDPFVAVLSPTPQVAFYAGIRAKTLPWGRPEDVINFAMRNSVKYLVVDDHFMGNLRLQNKYFEKLDPQYDSVRLIKHITAANGKSIWLYEIPG